MSVTRVGIIGGGLMGRELAIAVSRWKQLVDHPTTPHIVAVADPNEHARNWFADIDSVTQLTADWRELLANDEIDVVYIAVPHNLHEEMYLSAAASGKDFLAEKPFGIDLSAAERIQAAISASSCFVRVSSEMPFFPGALKAYEFASSGALGEILDVRSGFLHSSDLDRAKPINWKRQNSTCGEIGVMGDLGLHVAHVPLRLGWTPTSVYAHLDNVVTARPGADGEPVPCDTFDNALLALRVPDGARDFAMLWETRRIAPGNANTWMFEAIGMDGGVRFSTRTPTYFTRFTKSGKEQVWQDVQPGNVSVWPVISGAIFEFGFSDTILQMWAAYFAEREGALDGRFGCARVDEVVTSHRVFEAALRSNAENSVAQLQPQ